MSSLLPYNNSIGYSLSDYSSNSSSDYGTGHHYTGQASMVSSTAPQGTAHQHASASSTTIAAASSTALAPIAKSGLTLTQSLPDDISMMVMRSGNGLLPGYASGNSGQFATRKHTNRLPYFLSVPSLPGMDGSLPLVCFFVFFFDFFFRFFFLFSDF
jgi:hypothetical protein